MLIPQSPALCSADQHSAGRYLAAIHSCILRVGIVFLVQHVPLCTSDIDQQVVPQLVYRPVWLREPPVGQECGAFMTGQGMPQVAVAEHAEGGRWMERLIGTGA